MREKWSQFLKQRPPEHLLDKGSKNFLHHCHSKELEVTWEEEYKIELQRKIQEIMEKEERKRIKEEKKKKTLGK
jgi:hypothetical protein